MAESMTGAGLPDLRGAKTRRGTVVAMAILLAIAIGPRFVYPEADPPQFFCMGTSAGDEGWQHEARNKALWGAFHVPGDDWRTSVVSWPSNALTYVVFSQAGVSTQSLRLAPRVLGVLAVLLIGWAAWVAWGRRAGLVAALAAAMAFPLMAYARVALLEGFMIPVQALLLGLMLAQLGGRRVGFLVGLVVVLNFAVKASAILYLIPMALAWLVMLVVEKRSGRTWGEAIRRLGIPGMVLGIVVGAAVFWFVVVRGQYEDWLFLNFKHFGAGRASGGPLRVVENFIKLPTHSEAVLVAVGPLVLLATIAMVRALAALPAVLRPGLRDEDRTAIRAEAFVAITLAAMVPCLSAYGSSDVAGRRVVCLLPPILLMVAALQRGRGPWQVALANLSVKGRLVVLVLASPMIYVGTRAFYGLLTQGVRSLVTPFVWWEPMVLLKEGRALAMDFGPYFLLTGVGVLACVFWPRRLPLRAVAVVLLVTGLAVQGVWIVDYFQHRTYTMIEACRVMARLVPADTPVLGHAGDAVSWESGFRALFAYPGITYANKDEDRLRGWNAPLAIVYAKSSGFQPGDKVDWDDEAGPKTLSPIFLKNPSSLWRSYTRVVAVWPVDTCDPGSHDPVENRGYYLLLARDGPGEAPVPPPVQDSLPSGKRL
jgi:hypothetical protein